MQWEAPDPIPPERALAEAALDALDALRGVIEPLAADLVVVCSDADNRCPQGFGRPPRPFWYVSATDLESSLRIAPRYVDVERSGVRQLDRLSLLAWIEGALAQPCDRAAAMTAWAELSIRASGARIYRDVQEPALILAGEKGAIEAPIHLSAEGTRWARGPVIEAPTAPFTVEFVSEGGVVSLTIHVHWAWWTIPGSAERRALDRALAQIEEHGWQSLSTDLESS